MLESLSEVDVVCQERLLLISKYYQLASCIVLLYDHIITFDLEVERVWLHNITFPDVLFGLNRYFPLISYVWIVTAYQQTTWPPSMCRTFLHFPLIMVLISEMIIMSVVALRLYAMYFRSRRVLAFIGALVAVETTFSAWAAASVKLYHVPPRSGCIITVQDGRYYVFGLLWAWSILFDSTVCLLTVAKCLKNRYSSRGIRTPLFDLLLRDGVMYFAAMTAVKIVNFVVFWVVSRDLITINWTFNHTIIVLLLSRLFLNVRAEGTLTVYSMQSRVLETTADSDVALLPLSSSSDSSTPSA